MSAPCRVEESSYLPFLVPPKDLLHRRFDLRLLTESEYFLVVFRGLRSRTGYKSGQVAPASLSCPPVPDKTPGGTVFLQPQFGFVSASRDLPRTATTSRVGRTGLVTPTVHPRSTDPDPDLDSGPPPTSTLRPPVSPSVSPPEPSSPVRTTHETGTGNFRSLDLLLRTPRRPLGT